MSSWKRLTAIDGSKVDINMEGVAYMARYNDTTGVVFVGGKSDGGSVLGYAVKETPDQIHKMKPLKSA
jgi:hypothetical protein